MNKTVGRAGRTNSKAKFKKPRSQLIKKKQEVSLSLYQENGKLSQKCQYSNPFIVIYTSYYSISLVSLGLLSNLITLTKTNHEPIAVQSFVH